MKLIKISMIFLTVNIISISNVLADHTGVITLYTLTAQATNQDRGPCITMSPAIPGSGYACLYKSNLLYKELNALLLAMYTTKNSSCGIEWSGDDVSGHKILANINCR